jgi:hypothetical protein
MKSGKKPAVLCIAICVLGLAGCATTGSKLDEKKNTGPLYVQETGRADMLMAVLRPAGKGIDADEQKFLDIIQSVLNDNFKKFSAITLSDIQNMEAIVEYQTFAASGIFSDEGFISIGNITNSRYLLVGTLLKVNAGSYNLDLSIVDSVNTIKLATYNKNVTFKELSSLSAINAATAELLPQLGVVLTDNGKSALTTGQSEAEAEAQNALAMSMEAGRQGDFVTSLIYSYSASELDANSAAAKTQAAAAFKLMGGAGGAIIDDFQKQQLWKKNLTEFEKFYREHPPFEIVYTSVPIQDGTSDYDSGTADFSFYIGLRNKRNVRVMQKVLNDILKELRKTAYKRNEWGFDDWPRISAESTKKDPVETKFFAATPGYQEFSIVVGLFNNRDENVGTTTFSLYGQLLMKNGSISSDSTQERRLHISNVDINRLTEDMQIRILTIDGVDADKSNKDNYVKNAVVRKMLIAERSSISKAERKIPELPEERAARLAETARKEKMQEYWATRPLAYRFGINAATLYNPSARSRTDALSFSGGLEIGIKNVTVEGWAHFPLTSLTMKDDTQWGLGGGAGYTFVWKHFLLSLEGGLTHYWLDDNTSIAAAPNMQVKLDIIPGEHGLTFRFGYMAEFGAPDWGKNYDAYFNKDMAFQLGALWVVGKPMLGMVLWF